MNNAWIIGGGLLALVALSKPAGRTPPRQAPRAAPADDWVDYGPPAPGRAASLDGRRLTGEQQAVFDGLGRAFAEVGGLTDAQRLALLAFAWHESRYNPRAEGRVDARWGNSYTVFQLRRDVELAQAMQALGLSFSQVVPPAGVSGAALYPYLRNQVRVARWLADVKGVGAVWRNYAGASQGDEKAFISLALKWAGIVVHTWEELQRNQIAGPVLSRFGSRLPTNAEIPGVNAELRARGSQVMGTLDRLVTYRQLKSQLAPRLAGLAIAGLGFLPGGCTVPPAPGRWPVGHWNLEGGGPIEPFVGPSRRILGATRRRETRPALLWAA